MGIADDIRPKKNKTREVEKETEGEKAENLDADGGELVAIKRGDGHDFVDEDIEDQLNRDAAEANKPAKEDMSEYFYRRKETKPERAKKPINMGKWIIVLLILALVGIIIWQNLDSIKSYFGIKNASNSGSSNSSNPYSNFSVTGDSGTGTASTDSGTSASDTTESAAATAPTTAPAKTSYSISVLNGNGIKGSAAAVTAQITAAGYTVTNSGNALKFSYADTIIYYKTGDLSTATDIKSVLSDRTCELSEDNSIVGKYDIVVVVGKT